PQTLLGARSPSGAVLALPGAEEAQRGAQRQGQEEAEDHRRRREALAGQAQDQGPRHRWPRRQGRPQARLQGVMPGVAMRARRDVPSRRTRMAPSIALDPDDFPEEPLFAVGPGELLALDAILAADLRGELAAPLAELARGLRAVARLEERGEPVSE